MSLGKEAKSSLLLRERGGRTVSRAPAKAGTGLQRLPLSISPFLDSKRNTIAHQLHPSKDTVIVIYEHIHSMIVHTLLKSGKVTEVRIASPEPEPFQLMLVHHKLLLTLYRLGKKGAEYEVVYSFNPKTRVTKSIRLPPSKGQYATTAMFGTAGNVYCVRKDSIVTIDLTSVQTKFKVDVLKSPLPFVPDHNPTFVDGSLAILTRSTSWMIVDLDNGRTIVKRRSTEYPIRDAVLNPTHAVLLASNTIYFLSLGGASEAFELEYHPSPTCVHFTSASSVLVGDLMGGLKMFDIKSGKAEPAAVLVESAAGDSSGVDVDLSRLIKTITPIGPFFVSWTASGDALVWSVTMATPCPLLEFSSPLVQSVVITQFEHQFHLLADNELLIWAPKISRVAKKMQLLRVNSGYLNKMTTDVEEMLKVVSRSLADPHRTIDKIERRYKNKVYADTFTATELVDWLLKRKIVKTREKAVILGRGLAATSVIVYVSNNSTFEDNPAILLAHEKVVMTKLKKKKKFRKRTDPSAISQMLLDFPHGTLSEIVQNSLTDTALRFALLLNYASFTTAASLLDELLTKYTGADPKEQRECISVLRCWMTIHRHDFNNSRTELLRILVNFSVFGADPGHYPHYQELDKLIQFAQAGPLPHYHLLTSSQHAPRVERLAPQIPTVPPEQLLTLLDIHPHELARQLTLYSLHLLGEIDISEIAALATMDSQFDPNSKLLYALDAHAQFVLYFQSELLLEEDLGRRQRLLRSLLSTAVSLREMGNFSGLAAIVTALVSKPIARLGSTFAAFTNTDQADFEAIRSFGLETSFNTKLAAEIDAHQGACLPPLPLFVSELVALQDADYPKPPPGKHSLYHFHDVAKFARQLLAFQSSHYPFKRIDRIQDHFAKLRILSPEFHQEKSLALEDDAATSGGSGSGEPNVSAERVSVVAGGDAWGSTSSPRLQRRGNLLQKMKKQGRTNRQEAKEKDTKRETLSEPDENTSEASSLNDANSSEELALVPPPRPTTSIPEYQPMEKVSESEVVEVDDYLHPSRSFRLQKRRAQDLSSVEIIYRPDEANDSPRDSPRPLSPSSSLRLHSSPIARRPRDSRSETKVAHTLASSTEITIRERVPTRERSATVANDSLGTTRPSLPILTELPDQAAAENALKFDGDDEWHSKFPVSPMDKYPFVLRRKQSPHLKFANGQLFSATLIRLVEHFTLYAARSHNQQSFLDVYGFWASPSALFKLLQLRFNPPPFNAGKSSRVGYAKEIVYPLRARVALFFTKWLKRRPFDLRRDPALWEEAQTFFSQSICGKVNESVYRDLMKMIKKNPLPSAVTADSPASFQKPLGDTQPEDCNVTHFDPEEVARQLTLHDFELFAKVHAGDLHSPYGSKGERVGASLRPLFQRHQTLVKLVVSEIDGASKDVVKKVVARWSAVAENLTGMNNWQAFDAIVSALARYVDQDEYWSSQVQRSRLRRRAQNRDGDFEEIVSSLVQPTKMKILPQLPLMTALVESVDQVFSRLFPNTAPDKELNFEAMTEMATFLKQSLYEFQAAPYPFRPVPELQQWLASHDAPKEQEPVASVDLAIFTGIPDEGDSGSSPGEVLTDSADALPNIARATTASAAAARLLAYTQTVSPDQVVRRHHFRRQHRLSPTSEQVFWVKTQTTARMQGKSEATVRSVQNATADSGWFLKDLLAEERAERTRPAAPAATPAPAPMPAPAPISTSVKRQLTPPPPLARSWVDGSGKFSPSSFSTSLPSPSEAVSITTEFEMDSDWLKKFPAEVLPSSPFPGTVPTSDLVVEKSGTVKSGSLARLVERLTLSHCRSQDLNLLLDMYTFCHRPKDLFSLLRRRFSPSPLPGSRAKQTAYATAVCNPLRANVSALLHRWYQRRAFDVSRSTSQQTLKRSSSLQVFLERWVDTVLRDGVDVSVHRTLVTTMRHSEPVIANPPLTRFSVPSRKSYNCTSRDFDPVELARQICLNDYTQFTFIRPGDLQPSRSDHEGGFFAPSLRALLKSSDRLRNRVVLDLETASPSKREETMDQWVAVGQNLRALHNSHSYCVLMDTLGPYLSEQPYWSHDESDQREFVWAGYAPFLKSDPRAMSRVVKEIMSDSPSLPYIFALLREVKVFFERNGSATTPEGHLNLTFLRKLREEILSTLFLQPILTPFAFTSVPFIQDWLFGDAGDSSDDTSTDDVSSDDYLLDEDAPPLASLSDHRTPPTKRASQGQTMVVRVSDSSSSSSSEEEDDEEADEEGTRRELAMVPRVRAETGKSRVSRRMGKAHPHMHGRTRTDSDATSSSSPRPVVLLKGSHGSRNEELGRRRSGASDEDSGGKRSRAKSQRKSAGRMSRKEKRRGEEKTKKSRKAAKKTTEDDAADGVEANSSHSSGNLV